jgi:hypothetical protein
MEKKARALNECRKEIDEAQVLVTKAEIRCFDKTSLER